MNGRTLALGLTAGLAVASVLSKRQGARNGWDRDDPGIPPDAPLLTWAGFIFPANTPLFHATGAMTAIRTGGFKTRSMGVEAAGGGRHIHSVSLTLSRRRAEALALGLYVLARGARGALSISDLLDALEYECPKGFKSGMGDVGLTPDAVARYDRGEVLVQMGSGAWDEPERWVSAEVARDLPEEIGGRRVTTRTRDSVFLEVYRSVLRYAAREKECFNPIFIRTSMPALARVNLEDIGVLDCRVRPGMRVCTDSEGAYRLGYVTEHEARLYSFSCENEVQDWIEAQRAARGLDLPRKSIADGQAARIYVQERDARQRASARGYWAPKLSRGLVNYGIGNRISTEAMTYSDAEEEVRVFDPSAITASARSSSTPPSYGVPFIVDRFGERVPRVTAPWFDAATEDIAVWQGHGPRLR